MLSEKTTDVTFVVGRRRFACHRALLGACSLSLRQLMKTKEPECEIALKGISAPVFHCVLQILYGDRAVIRVLMLPKLLRAAIRLKCGRVLEACKAFVSSSMTAQHACFLLEHTLHIEGGELVRDQVERFIAIHAQSVIHTKGFGDLSLDAMLCVLRLALVVRPLDLVVACLQWAVAEADRQGEAWRVVMKRVAPLLPLQDIQVKDVVQHILPLGILSAADALDLMTLLSGLPPVARPLSPFSPAQNSSTITTAASPWGVRVLDGPGVSACLFNLTPRSSGPIRLAGDRSFAFDGSLSLGPLASARSAAALQAWQADIIEHLAGSRGQQSASREEVKAKEAKEAWRIEMLDFDPDLYRIDIGIAKCNAAPSASSSSSPPTPSVQPSDIYVASSTGDLCWRSSQGTPIDFAIKQGATVDCMLDLHKGTLSISSGPGHSTFSSEAQGLSRLLSKDQFVPYFVLRNIRPDSTAAAAGHPPCRLKIFPIPIEFYGR